MRDVRLLTSKLRHASVEEDRGSLLIRVRILRNHDPDVSLFDVETIVIIKAANSWSSIRSL